MPRVQREARAPLCRAWLGGLIGYLRGGAYVTQLGFGATGIAIEDMRPRAAHAP